MSRSKSIVINSSSENNISTVAAAAVAMRRSASNASPVIHTNDLNREHGDRGHLSFRYLPN
uniref:Uncharacterized protein n=1 Tax=Brassica oleracea TaxID=3712 RepID=A0A3P6DZK2_BRAOL|nr:unnamed protein product [Brassica oleracea]